MATSDDPLWDKFQRIGIRVMAQERGLLSDAEVAVAKVIQRTFCDLLI